MTQEKEFETDTMPQTDEYRRRRLNTSGAFVVSGILFPVLPGDFRDFGRQLMDPLNADPQLIGDRLCLLTKEPDTTEYPPAAGIPAFHQRQDVFDFHPVQDLLLHIRRAVRLVAIPLSANRRGSSLTFP